ncbi:uncharacterized protein LOC111735604 [Pteropus vampyrus]|uniref:Uncharacterized protein LOC111735604 n=1 Tax=Pteropus vampyrus TaxID=132908 RepID=A0A6P6C6A3_PTEVA|nr:uncharacterized protein LOC111735604 [Pteropus vampyrus]
MTLLDSLDGGGASGRMVTALQSHLSGERRDFHSGVPAALLTRPDTWPVSFLAEHVHRHLEQHEVRYLQFAFRWMNNLLTRELPPRCAVRLWDTYQMFAEAEAVLQGHTWPAVVTCRSQAPVRGPLWEPPCASASRPRPPSVRLLQPRGQVPSVAAAFPAASVRGDVKPFLGPFGWSGRQPGAVHRVLGASREAKHDLPQIAHARRSMGEAVRDPVLLAQSSRQHCPHHGCLRR